MVVKHYSVYLMLALLLVPGITRAIDIPALSWTERSDWVNVKTDVMPAAVGDGITDDTAAIQAALNLLAADIGSYKAVYFPSGTYRITATLTLTRTMGNLLVGCGRNTRIVWDGASGGRMFHSNGNTRQRFVGITWDGNNLASVGIDHDARTGTYYESQVLHRHERFMRFSVPDGAIRAAGIRVGHDQQIASAEITYQNCFFNNNTTGVSFLQFNDYDNTFTGCEFQDNEYGIYCAAGNWYVRNCHFARSTAFDVYMQNAHSNSLRRCTSTGSGGFFAQAGSSNMTPICIQDCRVDGWTNTTWGAIVLGCGGPNTIFDCVFTNPPNTTPPVRLWNGSYMTQTVISSNNVSAGTTAVVQPSATCAITDVPAGAIGGSTTSASQSFLQETVPGEGTVFDAKRDFGAVGNGAVDDTTALRNCIAAAKAAGNRAVAYIPSGNYRITGTLTLDGGNYTVSGSGLRTGISWQGAADGTAFSVVDPQSVRLEQMSVSATVDTACRIRQTSATGGSSYMVYDGVSLGGSWLTPQTRWMRGLECVSLPEGAMVQLEHLDGNVHLINCSRARVLANVHYNGKIKVEGAQSAKTGFTGWLTRVTSGNDYDLFVKDNQDIVISDWYAESTTHLAYITGDDCTVPGRVTVQQSKAQPLGEDPIIVIDNYTGRIFWGKSYFMKVTQPTCAIAHTGMRPLDLLLVGNAFYNYLPDFDLDSAATVYLLGNVHRDYIAVPPVYGIVPDAPNPFTQEAKDKVALALDDLAELGRQDLSVNYPGLVPRTTNLKLWLTAEAGVTKNGSNQVSNWADGSGQGNHAFNPGGASTEQPLYVASALNSKPVIRFDGVNDNFILGSKYLFADNTKTGITFVAVVKSTADRTNTVAFLYDFGAPAAGGPGYAFWYDLNFAGLIAKGTGAGYACYFTHAKGTNYVIYTGVIKFGAGSTGALTVRLNGVQRATATMTNITQLTAAEINEYPVRGGGGGTSGPVSLAMQSKALDATRNLQGDIAEILWYDSAFTSADALEVERYLSAKWGIPLE